ncbi:MAG: hypothetical protein ACQEUO_16270 [Bacillota bacterium]|uniref:Uncharacterized protein n=1 Tax=Bacillus pumilus TaxID=1408 RepID=A0A2G8ITM5_BACPU|nr:hypothetical protein [Bacillus pumilus]PIK26801.1 hypothetical protein CTV99_10695 [Bacillus pumilus]
MKNHFFMEAEEVREYLKKRYGEPHNMASQLDFKKAIIRDHNNNEIKQMIERLDFELAIWKDRSSLKLIPFSLFTALMTSITTVFVSVFVFFYSSENWALLGFTSKGALNMAIAIIIAILCIFIVTFLSWFSINRINQKFLHANYTYKLLLKEALAISKNRSKKSKSVEKNTTKIEKLKEFENVIYSYSEKETLSYFKEIFIFGKKKDHYKKNLSLLYSLDIDCLEFAIARFSYMDNRLDPTRRNLMAIIPLFLAFLTITFDVIEPKWLGFVFVTLSILLIMWFLEKDRLDRIVSGSMLKTFEQVHARKQKGEK